MARQASQAADGAPERETVLHSWCVQTEWQAPTVIGGEGARLFTAEGRTILDMSSLAECSNLGHQHPRLIAAIRAQAQQLCFVTSAWGAEPRARLASLLLDAGGYPGGRVFFTLGGADANEHAVKFARAASGKPHGWVITRERSYHGASYAAMALSGDARTAAQVDPATFRVLHVPPPYAYRCPFGTASARECAAAAVRRIEQAIGELGAREVAAVMMEPNAGTNGVVAPDEFWPALRAATRASSTWLIADEVMSAFGRCGEWFAWQRYGADARPDAMTLAKGLTGAHVPLGAVVLTAELARALEPQMLMTGLTYCGHPLACAAGVAAIESYREEALIERSRRLGAAMLQELERMQARHAVIGEVRGGHGLFAVIELVSDRLTRVPLAPWPQQHRSLGRLLQDAMSRGVSFAARGNLLLLAPPLVIGERELADALALLDELLGELTSSLAGEQV
jgi:taurine---2-oxoglutarate transaminase